MVDWASCGDTQIKCGRCGGEYPMETDHAAVARYGRPDSTDRDTYALCPSCMVAFDQWIAGQRVFQDDSL